MRGSRLLLAVLVLSALTLTVLDRSDGGGPFGVLRRAADTVLGPAQTAVGGAASSVGRAIGAVTGVDADEVSRLEQENARLRSTLREAEGLQRTAAQVQALLKVRAVADYPVVPARVVGVGSALGFARTVTLDAGSRDGVRVGQTVLAGGGLVGRTKRVGPFTSTVVLLDDPEFTVGGRLTRLGGVGLVHGNGAGGLRLEIVDADARVVVGDVVQTTSSGTFVPDLPVGRITRVLDGGSALTRLAEVEPFVDLGALDVVGVVVGPARTGPRTPVVR